MARRKRHPGVRSSLPTGRIIELRRRGAGGLDTWYAYSCKWCLEGFSSTKRERVISWTVSHLNRHIKASAARSAEEILAEDR